MKDSNLVNYNGNKPTTTRNAESFLSISRVVLAVKGHGSTLTLGNRDGKSRLPLARWFGCGFENTAHRTIIAVPGTGPYPRYCSILFS